MPFDGNRSSFIQAIIEAYTDMMLRIAFQYVKNQADAEDVVQDVFLKMIHSDIKFESEEHMKAWLIRATINKCKNHFKTAWFRKSQPLEENHPVFEIEEKEILEQLWDLPDNDRNILYLYYFEEHTIAEIADILKKKPNTVGSSLQRARKKLKLIFLQEGFNP